MTASKARNGRRKKITILILACSATLLLGGGWFTTDSVGVKAAGNGKETLLRAWLMLPGTDPNAAADKKVGGDTLLACAVLGRHQNCVNVLLSTPGIDVNKKNQLGESPLDLALKYRNEQALCSLLSAPGIDVSSFPPLHLAVMRNKVDDLEKWLDYAAAQVNQTDADGCTALHRAVELGRTGCVRLLLTSPEINAQCLNKQNETPLAMAMRMRKSECAQLIRHFLKSSQGGASILEVIRKGDVEMLRKLIAEGADVNVSQAKGATPLIVAIAEGNIECVRLLLQAPGIDVNLVNSGGVTALVWAALTGKTECIRLLLNVPGIQINKTGALGHTALHCAVSNGYLECAHLLLAAEGIDVNRMDGFGRTALHCAAMSGHTACLEALLAAPGLDVTITDSQGYTALQLAEQEGKNECAQLIRAFSGTSTSVEALTSAQATTALFNAAQSGNAQDVEQLIRAGADVNATREYVGSPLFLAVQGGHTACVKLLISVPNTEVNCADGVVGNTPLLWAVAKEHIECVQALSTAAGIDVNKSNHYMVTPLMQAVLLNNVECVGLLLKFPGIDVSLTNRDGKTALQLAEEQGYHECASLIRAAAGGE